MSRAKNRMSRSTHGLDGGGDGPNWRLSGLCISPDVDSDAWITNGRLTPANLGARRVCGLCPVRERCRDDMLDARYTPHPWSVIAGGWWFRQKKPPVPYPGDEHLLEAS